MILCSFNFYSYKLLSEKGIRIRSVTFDGCGTNFASFNYLLKSDVDEEEAEENNVGLRFKFVHPSDNEQEVYAIPDPSHMIKLARNALGMFFKVYSVIAGKETDADIPIPIGSIGIGIGIS